MDESSEKFSKELELPLSQKDLGLSENMMFNYIVKRLDQLQVRVSDMEEMQDWQSEEV